MTIPIKGSEQADLRINAGNEREGDHLGNEGERADYPGQNVTPHGLHAAEPFGTIKRERGTHVAVRSHGIRVRCACEAGCRCVVRRIGGRNSHPGFHRVQAVAVS